MDSSSAFFPPQSLIPREYAGIACRPCPAAAPPHGDFDEISVREGERPREPLRGRHQLGTAASSLRRLGRSLALPCAFGEILWPRGSGRWDLGNRE